VKQYYEYVVTVETNADAYYEQDQYRDDDAYECAADPNGGGFYVKLGCSPSSIYAIGFVAFTDDACLYEKRSSEQQEGDEVVAYDTGIDASFWQITFGESAERARGYTGRRVPIVKHEDQPHSPTQSPHTLTNPPILAGTCQSCIDYNVYQEMVENAEDDEELDFDQLNDESFCNLVWGESAVCGDDCQAMGMSTGNSTWEAREIVFLALELCAFFALSMGIFQKRQSMSSKELLIEQATAAHFDMKRIHLVGGCLGTLIIVVCFAAAKLVSATLGFMLALDLGALFYLLKLTLF